MCTEAQKQSHRGLSIAETIFQMVDVDMERWRSYFGKAGADIWTVIQEAINLAAMDYPKDFRERRGEIAETLFARNLVQLHCRDVKDEPCLILEEGEVRDGETGTRQMPEAVADADDHGNDGVERHLHSYHDEAEALTDELEEETIVLRELNSIKETIEDVDQPENVVLEALQRLQYTQITVEALKATEIGKQVNNLRKHSSKRVRAIVKELVRQWKVLVDEWVSSARDVTAATTTTTATAVTECGEFPEAGNHEEGLPSPPLDEGALLEARASSVELSQLFSFIDGEICGQPKDRDKPSSLVEPSVKDNLNYSSRSQSGSMLTDSSDFDTKASTSHPWGLRTPEERGSATRDMYPPSNGIEKKVSALKGQTVQRDKGQRGLNHDGGMPVSKSFTNGSGPGRPANDMSKVKITSGSVITGKASVHKTVAMHASSGDKASIMKSDKYKADQKLEIAKRKLHQGYQQAENAKKQRTVQVLDFSDLPKAGQVVQGKVNPPVQTKAGPQNGHWNQNRRYA